MPAAKLTHIRSVDEGYGIGLMSILDTGAAVGGNSIRRTGKTRLCVAVKLSDDFIHLHGG